MRAIAAVTALVLPRVLALLASVQLVGSACFVICRGVRTIVTAVVCAFKELAFVARDMLAAHARTRGVQMIARVSAFALQGGVVVRLGMRAQIVRR